MSTKKIIQRIAIGFLILAVILLIPDTDWNKSVSIIGFISLVCGTLGSIISIFIPTNYIFNFEEKDWLNTANMGYKITISSKKHGLGNSTNAKVYKLNENSYMEVIVGSTHDYNGNVTISANMTFKGKVVIS